jgi:transcription elongation factor GreA
MEDVLLTPAGHRRIADELERLSTVGRREVAQRIRAAREAGANLAEDAEYFDAMEEHARLEARIATVEQWLAHARVVELGDGCPDVAGFGTIVRLEDIEAGETVSYLLVGSPEANPSEHRLSSESPVGKALLGRRKGETVRVPSPRGCLEFRILDVRAA